MTHRLRPSTRVTATATTGAAVIAALDVLDRLGGSDWAVVVAVLLLVGGTLVARLHTVAIEVGDDTVAVHNLVSSHRVARDEVVGIVPGRWRSAVLLEDGRELPTLLREEDLAEDLGIPAARLIDLTALEVAA